MSLRNDFPDEWYTLVSQAQDPQPPASPLAVQLKISPDSFPPNYRNPTLRNLNLMMIRRVSSPPAFTVSLDHDAKHPGLSATAVTDVISTRSGSGASWLPLVDGTSPAGTWKVDFGADATTRMAFKEGAVDDVVLIFSYEADLPPWPL